MAEEVEDGEGTAGQAAPRMGAWGYNTEALIGQIITASVPVKGVYALPGGHKALIEADCVIVSAIRDNDGPHGPTNDLQLMVEVIGFPRTDRSEDYSRRQASLIGRVRTVMLSSDPYFHEDIIEAHLTAEAVQRRAGRTDPNLMPSVLEALSSIVRAYMASTQPPPATPPPPPPPAAEPLNADDYADTYGDPAASGLG